MHQLLTQVRVRVRVRDRVRVRVRVSAVSAVAMHQLLTQAITP